MVAQTRRIMIIDAWNDEMREYEGAQRFLIAWLLLAIGGHDRIRIGTGRRIHEGLAVGEQLFHLYPLEQRSIDLSRGRLRLRYAHQHQTCGGGRNERMDFHHLPPLLPCIGRPAVMGASYYRVASSTSSTTPYTLCKQRRFSASQRFYGKG